MSNERGPRKFIVPAPEFLKEPEMRKYLIGVVAVLAVVIVVLQVI